MKQLKIQVQITRRTESLDKYFQEIDKIQLISADEEVVLTRKIREGDQIAMEKLTKANLRFVVSVAKQYDRGGHNMTLQDLISEGNIGLIKAASRFDETRGFKFISYAVWWIRQAIISAISENSRTIRQPMNRVSTYNKILRSYSELEQKYEREPTDTELAEEMDVSEDVIIQMKTVGNRTASLDAPLHVEDAGNLLDLLNDPETDRPDTTTIYNSLRIDIKEALKTLTDREAEILILFFGLNGEHSLTLNDISGKLEITMERVRQIKECALHKLQKNQQQNSDLRSYFG